MLYVVRYRDYEIFRDDPAKPFQIRKHGQAAIPGEFHAFADAREHIDGLKRPRFNPVADRIDGFDRDDLGESLDC